MAMNFTNENIKINICVKTKKQKNNTSKLECKKCHKYFTYKTLKKNNGICKKCFNSNIGITKKNIPKRLKEEVWKHYVGDKFETKCYVCEKTITAINFQTGHIESRRNGGKLNIDNLRPVCKKCNSQVGVFNMKDFKDALTPTQKPKYILEEKTEQEKKLDNYIEYWNHSFTYTDHLQRLRFFGLLDLYNKKYPNSHFRK